MSKIFSKIYILSLIYNTFIPLFLGFYYCVVTKQLNSNKYYITTSYIPYNTYFYSYVITVIVYQICLKSLTSTL